MKVERLHLDLSDECCLSCSYCYVQDDSRTLSYASGRRVEPEKWVSIIEQALDLGIRKFILSGGEPLIFPGFLRILAILERDTAVRVSLMTNLFGANKDVLQEVVRARTVREIVTSLDGFEGHNKARPPSDWRQIESAIRRFRAEDASPHRRIVVNTVLHRQNLHEMGALQELIAELGVDVWRLDIPIKPRRLEIVPPLGDAVSVISSIIRKRYERSDLQKVELVAFRVYKSALETVSPQEVLSQVSLDVHPCDYFLGTLAIKPNGDITLCSPLQHRIGNIFSSENIARAFVEATQANFFSVKASDIPGCAECRYAFLCGTGCRADALRWTGNAMNPDPVSCVLMPLVEEKIIPVLSPHARELYTGFIQASGSSPVYSNLIPLERR